MPVEELSPVPTKGSRGLTCFIQPSEMSELEAELKKRLKANVNCSQVADHGGTDSASEDEDPDALIDAWRAVRSSCRAAMMRFVKNGGQGDATAIPFSPSFCQYLADPNTFTDTNGFVGVPAAAENMNSSSIPTAFPYTFPSKEHLDLLAFTLRYSSMGKAFAGLISGWGIGAVLLDMVTYHSSILCGNGYEVAVDLSAGTSNTTHQKNEKNEWSSHVEESKAGDFLQDTTQHFISRLTELISLPSNHCSTKGATCDSYYCVKETDAAAREKDSEGNAKSEEGLGTNHAVDDTPCGGGEEEDDLYPAATRQWLKAVTAFIAGCEKIIANCSGATAIALGDTSLFMVRHTDEQELVKVEENFSTVTPNYDEANATTNSFSSGATNGDPLITCKSRPLKMSPPLLPPRTEIRVSYSDYSVSETGARLWGGGVALALFVAEKASILLAQSGGIASGDDEKEKGREKATASSQPQRLFVELGAGVALPTCALIHSYMCATSHNRLSNENKKRISGNPDDDKCEISQIQCVVTDVFESILKCAEKNVRRQLLLESREIEGRECKGEKNRKKNEPSATLFRTEIVDFFKVEAYVQAQKEGTTLPENDNHPNPTLEGACDVILATDIVYDYKIGKAGIATLATMLRPCPMLSPKQSPPLPRRRVEGKTSESESYPSSSLDSFFSCSFTSVDDVLLSWRDGRQCFAPQIGRLAEEKDEVQNQVQTNDDATSETNREGIQVSRGGIALICCESHRDAMPLIYDFFRDNGLVVLWHEKDCQNTMRYYTIPEGVTISSCELFLVAKAGGGVNERLQLGTQSK